MSDPSNDGDQTFAAIDEQRLSKESPIEVSASHADEPELGDYQT